MTEQVTSGFLRVNLPKLGPKLDSKNPEKVPQQEKLGTVLERMNRAQRRAYMANLKRYFKHQGMNLV